MDKRKNDVVILPSAKNDYQAPLVLDYAKIKHAAFALNAVNHPLRQQLVDLLEEKETMTSIDFSIQLKVLENVVTFHLNFLERAKIIHSERFGNTIKYFLDERRWYKIAYLVKGLSEDTDVLDDELDDDL